MNLIVIYTPLQFINARRFISENNQDSKIIVLASAKQNLDQIRALDYEKLCSYPLLTFNFLHKEFLWIIKLVYVSLLNTTCYKSLVLGNYNDLSGYLLMLRFEKSKKNIFLLDDGMATVNIYYNRNALKKSKYVENVKGGNVGKILKIIGYLNTPIQSVTFYTNIDLDALSEPYNDKIVLFQQQKFDKPKSKDNSSVWFIGQPLVKNKIINQQLFDELMVRIYSMLKLHFDNIIYIYHRSENSRINENWTSRRLGLPIEEEIMLSNGNLPKAIITFYSTAIYNISQMDCGVELYYVDISKHTSVNHSVTNVYTLLSKVKNLHEIEV